MSANYVVTGSTSGIGRAIVNKILLMSQCDEDRIVVNYGHNDELARKMLDALDEADRNKIILIKGDLSSYEGMKEFVAEIKSHITSLDYLVCNTGIGTYMKFADYTFEVWNNIMNTNVSVPAFMIRELYDIFNCSGSIILMGSYAGERPYSSSVVYSVSKAALIFLSSVLIKELEPKGIRINSIAPGFIETDWQKDRSDDSRERINRKIALHRFGEPSEVADLCYSIMTNTYVNGDVVDIHGGYDYF